MRKLFSCLILTIYMSQALGQQNAIDKNKVSEYFQNEQYLEAINHLVPYLTNNTEDIFLLNSLGYAYLMSEQTAAAELFYKRANRVDSTNFTSNKYLAQIERERENFEQALFYTFKMISAQPQNASLYKSSGDLFLALKMDDSSLHYYLKAYQLQPLNIKYASPYVVQMLNKKKYSTVDSILKIFLSIDSTSVTAMNLAIRSFYEQNDYKTVASFSQRWLNVNRDEINLPTSIRLAIANYELKNYLTSYKVCDTVIKQEFLDERILYYAARALTKLGQYRESNGLLAQCLDLSISKTAENYFFQMGENFESLKQYKPAIAANDTAYYLFQAPLTLYNIGRLYETGLKNKTRAIEYYKRYLKKASPSSAQEKKVYAYLEEMLEDKKVK
jgi:tetratricopeptide (TPR) repeat protein